MYLDDNELSGEIPPELAELSELYRLHLAGNELVGCIPQGLQDVPNNDLHELNLPTCVCVEGGAVADESNRGLVSDCNTLLASRDTLTGTATLNWSADIPITDWDGITIGGMPGRVTELFLASRQFTGSIPPELGRLSSLVSLNLSDNELAGEIPSEFVGLSGLESLDLSNNELAGEIPSELGNLSNLRLLDLRKNQLSGTMPPDLGQSRQSTRVEPCR